MALAWDHIIKIISACQSPQDFADRSMELLGNPIVIFDLNMIVVACTETDVDDPYFQHLKQHRTPSSELIADAAWRRKILHIVQEDVTINTGDLPKSSAREHLSKTLRINGTIVGQIDCAAHFRPFTDMDVQILELISFSCSAMLYNRIVLQHPGISELDYFLEYLLDGHRLPEDAVQFRLSNLNWYSGSCLYMLCTDAYDVGAEFQFGQLSRMLSTSDKIVRYKQYILAVLSRSAPLSEQELEHLQTHAAQAGFSLGVSVAFSQVSEVRNYYNQACMALDIGQRVHPQKVLYRFGDYLEYAMLMPCCQSEDPLQFVLPGLVPFALDSQNRKLGIMRTIKLYLDCERSIQKVADQMHMHRNTVNYRISRVMDALRIDPSDGKQMLRLSNSLLILEYLDREKYF